MPMPETRRDRRYTVAREYCGYPKPRHVARFCGEWLGNAANRRAALAIARGHAVARNSLLEGQTP